MDRHVAPLGHIILIPTNQSLLFLLNAECLAEKQQIPILRTLGFIRSVLEPKITRTRGKHANHYTIDVITTTTSPVIESNGQIWKSSNKNIDI